MAVSPKKAARALLDDEHNQEFFDNLDPEKSDQMQMRKAIQKTIYQHVCRLCISL